MKEKHLSTVGIKILLVFVALFIFLMVAQRLLVPKYVGKMAEGSLIEEYYACDKENDVIFLGDSEVYYNFSPKVLEEEYGFVTYIRGSANQSMWQSYYLLLDTLRYETPKAVVLSVSSMMKEKSDSEPYNRMTIDGMEWSQYKYECIKESMTEDESFVSYVFPIFRYHDRWSQLSGEDFKYFLSKPQVSYRGYIEKTEIVPMGQLPSKRPLENYQFSEKAVSYLEDIKSLCQEKGIKLILVKSPSQYPYWYEQWEEQIEEFTEDNDILYVNLLEDVEEIGLDFNEDTFDGGLHLNGTGAKKNTKYFGKILLEEIDDE